MEKAIFLMGPTAAGKTELALSLAAHFPIEIISVDSAMVYRGMDIGTGKPNSEELASVPHHLINIREPHQTYSAAEFARDASQLMHAIRQRNRIPVLVGGTLLYFRALQQGLSPLPSADPAIRAKLFREAEEVGWAVLHERLASIDPESAKRIHPNDPQRIQRALEVYEMTGKTMSAFFHQNSRDELSSLASLENVIDGRTREIRLHSEEGKLPNSCSGEFSFAIIPEDRGELHQKIAARFHKMLDHGLVAEVEALYQQGNLDPLMPSMRCVGYRQIWQYLRGDFSYNEMVDKAIAATRQLAKRQLTWLRSLENIKKIGMNHLASLKTMIHCLS